MDWDDLLKDVEKETKEIDKLLLVLLYLMRTRNKQEASKILPDIFTRLRKVSGILAKWADDSAADVVEKWFRKSRVAKDLSRGITTVAVQKVRTAISQVAVDVERSVRARAGRLSRTDAKIAAKTPDSSVSASVDVFSKTGRTVRYEPSYYAGMVLNSAVGWAVSDGVIEIVSNAGDDLVQVSPNPSTIGDFCDAFRGKVFSVSGTHRFFPPLSWVPNGRPPFHVWCHHYLVPYYGGFDSELRMDESRVLELSRSGASTNELQQEWLSA